MTLRKSPWHEKGTSFSTNTNAAFVGRRRRRLGSAWPRSSTSSSTTDMQLLAMIQENLVIKSFWEVLRVFCRETNLHGLKHVFGSKDSGYNLWHKRLAVRISRVLWFLSVLAGIYCAVLMMSLVWRRFKKSPTLTTIDTTSHPIWEVAFPAVTICNINKVYAPNAVNITDKLLAKGVAPDRILRFLELIPNLINPEVIEDEFLNISRILQNDGYTTVSLMSELAQPCDRLLRVCMWMGTVIPCHEIFKLSLSTEGICCSFNYKALKSSLELDTDFHYESQQIYYVSGSGRNMGLHVLLDVETQHSLAMSKSIYGAEVLIHDAEEVPQASLTSAIVQPNRDVTMSIVPTVIESQLAVRSLPVDERFCYFYDEQKLRTTRKYSLNACLAECRVNHMLSMCNCLPFFYPEIPAIEARYPQCGLSDVACLRKYRTFFSSVQPQTPAGGMSSRFNTTEEIGMTCTCYQACHETSYGFTTIDVERKPTSRHRLFPDMELENMTTLVVHFKDLTCIRYSRDVYMTWDGVMASFGGIFGFCLGGSVLSLVEMAYFFTIRLSLIIYRRIQGTNPEPDDNVPPPNPFSRNPRRSQTEVMRQEQRFQRILAESRRIYNLSPVLNRHFIAAEEQEKAQVKTGGGGTKKHVRLGW